MNLNGRVAVITGGGAGIGRAVALRLAADGARVAVLDIRQETAEQTLKLTGGEGIALVCDVSDSSAVDATFARIEAELGPVNILVNNAGAIGLDHLRRITPWSNGSAPRQPTAK
jgi:3-oxoacyl-[acyl-carrier protein] reductase